MKIVQQDGRGEHDNLWNLVVLVLSATLGLQVVRALFPLVTFHPDMRPLNMGLHVVAVFLPPSLTPLFSHWLKPKRLLFLALGGLAVSRLALQFTTSTDLSLALVTAAAMLALLALPLGVAQMRSAGQAGGSLLAAGLILALALDTALSSAFLTWDYIWQRNIPALILALTLSGLLALAIWHQRANCEEAIRESTWRNSLPIALWGPFFVLQMLLFQNVAFVASAMGLSLALASGLVLVGYALAVLASARIIRQPSPLSLRIAAGIASVVILLLLPDQTGVIAAALFLAAQVFASGFLMMAFADQPDTVHQAGVVRTSVGIGLGSLVFLLCVASFYASYQVPLPAYSQRAVQALAGAILALAAFRKLPAAKSSLSWQLAALPLVLLVVPFGLWIAQPGSATSRMTAPHVRLVTYNIHQGASAAGWIDLEGIAAAIEAQQPDVVVLQEVVRGQIVTGMADSLAWLSWQLKMPYRFAPATDSSYGEAILTRLPILAWQSGILPQGGAAQKRSYVRVTLDAGAATPVTVIGTHLDHISQQVRIPQVERLIAVWRKAPRTIIAGDMNTLPGTTEIGIFEAAGLISAQDITGHSDLLTFDSVNPSRRIDWIFGTPDLAFSDFVVPQTTASDHLPLAVTVTLP
jgi:endonuclease/exonuclease/phosphatase family metal-dependent hydrolase